MPRTGVKVGGQPVQAGPQDIIAGLGQDGHTRPDDGIEVGGRPAPEGRSEPVCAVIRDEYRFDTGPAEQVGAAATGSASARACTTGAEPSGRCLIMTGLGSTASTVWGGS